MAQLPGLTIESLVVECEGAEIGEVRGEGDLFRREWRVVFPRDEGDRPEHSRVHDERHDQQAAEAERAARRHAVRLVPSSTRGSLEPALSGGGGGNHRSANSWAAPCLSESGCATGSR